MAISHALLPEFDMEMANTRKTLERVPPDKLSFKPHPRSHTMAWMAGHLANIPSWASIALGQSEFDLRPEGKDPQPQPEPTNLEDVLAAFDKNVAAARDAISNATDQQLMGSWTLLNGGKPVLSLPRVAVVRSFVLNHSIHHRGQLTVYLRLNDAKVPALYGPSADEGVPGF